MWSLARLLLLFVSCAASATARTQPASPAGSAPNPAEDNRNGAVLCTWLIYREAVEIGDVCLHGRDAAFQDGLKVAIGKIDRFIMVNLPASQDQLAELKRRRVLMDPPDRLCEADPLSVYKVLEIQGVDGLEKNVARLLAVPRRPMADPCL